MIIYTIRKIIPLPFLGYFDRFSVNQCHHVEVSILTLGGWAKPPYSIRELVVYYHLRFIISPPLLISYFPIQSSLLYLLLAS